MHRLPNIRSLISPADTISGQGEEELLAPPCELLRAAPGARGGYLGPAPWVGGQQGGEGGGGGGRSSDSLQEAVK